MQQQNKWHIAKYQDNKNHPKFVQCAIYFVAALFKKLALITIIEMWGLE